MFMYTNVRECVITKRVPIRNTRKQGPRDNIR